MHIDLVSMPVLIGLIAIAYMFDIMNGLHDAANSIATIVTTRVLRPEHAVMWAAFFNFIAFLVFGLSVANTIGKGIVTPSLVDANVIFGALVGAITWNVITWRLGIPSSSSHALVGGLIGAAVAKAGFGSIIWTGALWYKDGVLPIIAAIILSPLLGFLLAMLMVFLVSWIFRTFTPYKVDSTFRYLQFVSASMYSLGHGGNDAQKTMGIIGVLLFSQGYLGSDPHYQIPFWVVISCQAAMGIGTLFGGWQIVKTMGSKITHLKPVQGFCAETGGALTLFGATWMGIPVSTTHTITGAIVGVGASKRASAVRWSVTQRIVIAWIITIPASASVAAMFYFISKTF